MALNAEFESYGGTTQRFIALKMSAEALQLPANANNEASRVILEQRYYTYVAYIFMHRPLELSKRLIFCI